MALFACLPNQVFVRTVHHNNFIDQIFAVPTDDCNKWYSSICNIIALVYINDAISCLVTVNANHCECPYFPLPFGWIDEAIDVAVLL